MEFNNPLLVPIEATAFVINEKVLSQPGLQQWQFNYPALWEFMSPQPTPFSGGHLVQQTGVVVHWTMPGILRDGKQGAEGVVNYPLVPNRWLVVRYSGPLDARTAVGWVVESDALSSNTDPVTGGAAYVDPFSDQFQPTMVGQVVPLPGYETPADPPKLFLTAVAPGNSMFAAYQPYCWNVFSIFDPLDGVANNDNLSYFIGGWYTDPTADITGSWQDGGTFQAFMDDAGWQLAQPSDDVASWSIYQGFVWNVVWDRDGNAPANVPSASSVKMSIGNTAAEALAALIKNQYNNQQSFSLINAFQHALLPLLDQQDASIQIEQQLKAAAFGYTYGGYGWDIVNATDSEKVAPALQDPAAAVNEAEWLAELNQNQQTFETALVTLNTLQENLFQVWYKYNYAISNGLSGPNWPVGTTQEEFEDALNPDLPDSLISQVYAQLQLVVQLQQSVPFGINQSELQAAIKKYADSKALPDTRVLKQFAKRPFCHPYDPVMLFNGLHSKLPLAPTEPLICRFMSQVVTGVNFNGQDLSVEMLQDTIPMPDGIQLAPSQMQSLLQECFFLDPLNATMIVNAVYGNNDPATINALYNAMAGGENVTGICPDLSLATWAQPWEPLVLLWDIRYYPIDHDADGKPLWNFDGNDYTWNGQGMPDSAPFWDYSGMIFMTTQASFNFRAQLEKLAIEYPGNEKITWLNSFITEVDNWDFLSQSLLGLSPYMKLRVPTPNVSPSVDATTYFEHYRLQELIGSNANYVPYPGAPKPPRFEPFPPSGFQPWRAGQFILQSISIIDKFGQACDIVTPQNSLNSTPILSPALQPQYPVLTDEGYRFIQLPPRLLQPARLNLDFVAANDDQHLLGTTPGTNPICGWLLHNYLDQSIACYEAAGNIIGTVSLVYNTQAQQAVHWEPSPGSKYPTIQDLIDKPELNHLGLMLQSMQQTGATAFSGMVATLDKASVNIDGAHTSTDTSLILLCGKPVAMVRARIQFELNGVPVTDPSWRFTFDPDPSPLPAWRFNIRLGETVQRSDGLIGYFIGDDYTVFYSDNIPTSPATAYLQSIGTGNSLQLGFDGIPAFVSILMDPRTEVHATTGILPIINITIPQEFVTPAFAAMDLNFHVGPLLSETVNPADPDNDSSAVVLPSPRLKAGTWYWEQMENDQWQTYSIAPISPTAQFSNVPAVVREGLLVLKGGVSD